MISKQSIKFSDIFREVKISSKEPLADGYERYIGLEHLDSDSLKIKRWGITAEDNPSFTRVFKKGYVLFGKRRPYLRKAAIAEFDGICSGDIIVLDIKEGINREFAYQFLTSKSLWDWAIRTSSGSLSPRTKFKELSKLEINIDIEKVNAASLVFKHVRDYLTISEDVFSSISNLKDSLILSAINARGMNLKPYKLQHISHLMVNGVVGKSTHAYNGGEVPYVMGKNVSKNKMLLEDLEHVNYAFHHANPRSVLCAGDVLVVQSGHIGTACVVPKELEGANCHALIIIRPNTDYVNPYYLSYYLNSVHVQHELKELHIGTTIKHINTGDLRKFVIKIPDLEIQDKIVEALTLASQETTLMLEKIKLSKKISDSIFDDIAR